MNEAELNLESFLAMSQLMGMGNRPINEFLSAHNSIADELQAYDAIKLAGTIGSLLAKPELQSNCYRLEVLLHMAIAQANGRKKPDSRSIARWFNLLEQGLCGRYEDPAEDVFVNSIETPEGNFRILEGLWESSGFYLQRIVKPRHSCLMNLASYIP